MQRSSLFIFILLFWAILAFGQIGTPPIRNFPKKEYRAGSQTWGIAQDRRGVMYFANNEGLLSFDGTNWRCRPLPNQTIVRALAIDSTGRIYVGGQGEIGYFYPLDNGVLAFHALRDLIPKDYRDFDDVWDIVIHDEGVFFRTNRLVFRLHEDRIEPFFPGAELNFMGLVQGKVFLQADLGRFFFFEAGAFQSFFSGGECRSPVTAVLSCSGDTTLVTTLGQGLFQVTGSRVAPFPTESDPVFRQERIFRAVALPDDRTAIGTLHNGVVILDHRKRIVQRLHREDGLQSDGILSLFSDRQGNLWLGLNNGVDCVNIQSAFTFLFPDGKSGGTGFDVKVSGGRIYFGTSNGLFSAPWPPTGLSTGPDEFRAVSNANWQVWGLSQIGDDLLMGHHEGAFVVQENQARRISPQVGAWTFVPLNDAEMLGGHYNGLALYRKVNGQWVFSHWMTGFEESCRVMVKDREGNIWMTHPYRGVYRVELEPGHRSVRVRHYGRKDGLPSDLFNYVFAVNGKAVFAAERGIFQYDPGSDRFEPDPVFDQIFGLQERVRCLWEDQEGNVWFGQGNEVGKLVIRDIGLEKKIEKLVFPELGSKLVGGFERIYPLDNQHIFIASEPGFIHFDPSRYHSRDHRLEVLLHEVRLIASTDSLLFGGLFFDGDQIRMEQPEEQVPGLPHSENGLRFSFSATTYRDAEFLEYQTRLLGLEENWSPWSAKTEREFNNLGAGNYIFQVKARTGAARESAVLSYRFVIQPPWYQTSWAYTAYALLGFGLLFLFLRRQRQLFESEKAALTSAHQRTVEAQQQLVEASEAEIARLRNEKLEAEIRHKNQELASAMMHLVQKNQMMQKLQEELDRLRRKTEDQPKTQREIHRMLQMVNTDNRLDEDWEQFAHHFDQVHSDFLRRLRDQYPQLSPNDYRLCAYLRMNLSTKEIAPIMNISVRGVEASRYRLRKKLNLDGDANLVDFLMNI